MNATEFAAEICRRLPVRWGHDVEMAFDEVETAAARVPADSLPALLECCLDNFSTIPTRAQVFNAAEQAGITTRSAAPTYQAYLCKACDGVYSVAHQGMFCPLCNARKSGNQVAILSQKPIELSQGAA